MSDATLRVILRRGAGGGERRRPGPSGGLTAAIVDVAARGPGA
ncbi:hypothetical protein [Plantactinospora veratri]